MIETDDLIRYGWTISAAIAVPYALWNLRDLLIDGYAVSQDRRQIVTDSEREQTKSDIWIHGLLAIVIMCNLAAGAFAISGNNIGALTCLFVALWTKIFLVFNHARRRRLIFALRRQPSATAPILIENAVVSGIVTTEKEDLSEHTTIHDATITGTVVEPDEQSKEA